MEVERGGRYSDDTSDSMSPRNNVKGRGPRRAAMDTERYGGSSGVFEKLDYKDEDKQDAAKSIEGWILFVTGVHEEAQQDDLMDAFGEDAPVKNMHLNLDRRTGFVKGYALVEFEEFDAAKDAIARLDGTEILGEKISVNWAFKPSTSDSRRSGRGRDRGRRR